MLSQREIFYQHVAQTSKNPMGLTIERAEGCYLYSPEGKKYLDLISGTSVSNVGHNNRYVINAVKQQLDKHMHISVYGEMIQSAQVLLTQKLVAILPEQLNSVYYVNSGSEAVEGALKLAKRYTGRRKIVALKNAYHGGTHGALSLTSSAEHIKAFAPLLPNITLIEINNIDDLKNIDEETACVIIEPVQGEAGVVKANNQYLNELRKTCSQKGALLIFDEIQSGMGRTGKWFYFQHSGIVPDILLTAKALGGGMPLGAFISSQEIMDSLTHEPVLGHITTFGGHPVCCAAANAAIDVIENEKLIEGVKEKSDFFYEFFADNPLVTEVRRSGLLIALQMGSPELAIKTCNACVKHGIIVDNFLFNESAIRIAPPLTISIQEIETACDSMQEIMYKV
ncbi:MAG: aspartate aminotransferase family protein [Lentimicrobiaceae bacterium]|nr:aspartate aminotransferase family protein [Lentimicrobiaceae bacterium]